MEDTKTILADMVDLLTTCLRNEFDKGMDAMDTEEAGYVADIIKDLSEAHCKLNESCYYSTVVAAMDEGKAISYDPQTAKYVVSSSTM